jgi:HEAT repeat protein
VPSGSPPRWPAGELKLEVLRSRLKAKLQDPDTRVRVAVRFALHRLGDFAHSRDLEQYAKDARPAVRGTTAMVLGRLGESSGVNILRTLRADPEAVVRQQAEEALFLLGDDRGREAIIGYTGSRYPDDVMFGLLALAENKDNRFRSHARSHLTNEYTEVALVAARAMGAMNADDGYGVAMNGIKSGDARQRQLAATAFGAIGRADAQEYLAPALVDASAEVRAAAATAILRIAQAPKRYTREGDVIS